MKLAIARVFLVPAIAALAAHNLASPGVFSPVVPRTWDLEALATLEVPLPDAGFSPRALQVDYYYRIPVRPIYRGYPVYAPGKEPPGYFDLAEAARAPGDLERRGCPAPLETRAAWVKVGEAVFDAVFFATASLPWLRCGTRPGMRKWSRRSVERASCRSPPTTFYSLVHGVQARWRRRPAV